MLTREDKITLFKILVLIVVDAIVLLSWGDDSIIQINDMLKALHY